MGLLQRLYNSVNQRAEATDEAATPLRGLVIKSLVCVLGAVNRAVS